MKTSSRSNPQPGTFVNVGVRETDIVFVSRYRVRSSKGGWNVYLQQGDKWRLSKRYRTRQQALDAIAEHMRSGQALREPIDPIVDLQRRLVALEAWRDAVEDDLARLREQCGFLSTTAETSE